MKAFVILLAVFVAGCAANTPAKAQTSTTNKPGLQPQGTLIPGNTVIVGTTPNDLKDGGPPVSKNIGIGDTVNGATPGQCLTVDAAGKLAQTACLTAH